MNTKNAVANRIIELCNQKNIAINALANLAGISPSTLYSVLNEKSQNPGIVTIKTLCDGLDISLREFFNSDIFDDIEQEIKQSYNSETSLPNFGREVFVCENNFDV